MEHDVNKVPYSGFDHDCGADNDQDHNDQNGGADHTGPIKRSGPGAKQTPNSQQQPLLLPPPPFPMPFLNDFKKQFSFLNPEFGPLNSGPFQRSSAESFFHLRPPLPPPMMPPHMMMMKQNRSRALPAGPLPPPPPLPPFAQQANTEFKTNTQHTLQQQQQQHPKGPNASSTLNCNQMLMRYPIWRSMSAYAPTPSTPPFNECLITIPKGYTRGVGHTGGGGGGQWKWWSETIPGYNRSKMRSRRQRVRCHPPYTVVPSRLYDTAMYRRLYAGLPNPYHLELISGEQMEGTNKRTNAHSIAKNELTEQRQQQKQETVVSDKDSERTVGKAEQEILAETLKEDEIESILLKHDDESLCKENDEKNGEDGLTSEADFKKELKRLEKLYNDEVKSGGVANVENVVVPVENSSKTNETDHQNPGKLNSLYDIDFSSAQLGVNHLTIREQPEMINFMFQQQQQQQKPLSYSGFWQFFNNMMTHNDNKVEVKCGEKHHRNDKPKMSETAVNDKQNKNATVESKTHAQTDQNNIRESISFKQFCEQFCQERLQQSRRTKKRLRQHNPNHRRLPYASTLPTFDYHLVPSALEFSHFQEAATAFEKQLEEVRRSL